MAVTALEPIQYPSFGVPFSNNRTITITSTSLTSAGHGFGAVFQAPKTGNIAALHFRSATVSVAGDADVRLETVDATTGVGSGTLAAANANVTRNVAANNTWYRNVLTAACPVTLGQRLCAVLMRTTGSYGISSYDTASTVASFPYGVINTGSWSKSGAAPLVLVEYDDGTFPHVNNLFPVSAGSGFNLSTAGVDQAGILFTAPVAFRTHGCVFHADFDGVAELYLLDTSNTVIAQATWIDPDIRSASGAGRFEALWDSPATLTAGQQYRLIVKATSATTVILSYWDVNTASYMAALPGGTDGRWTQRTGAGAWSQTTTRKAAVALMVNGVDIPAGGGLVGSGNVRGGFH